MEKAILRMNIMSNLNKDRPEITKFLFNQNRIKKSLSL